MYKSNYELCIFATNLNAGTDVLCKTLNCTKRSEN
jgi:hypothetical protein